LRPDAEAVMLSRSERGNSGNGHWLDVAGG